jgi:hypothetical protein
VSPSKEDEVINIIVHIHTHGEISGIKKILIAVKCTFSTLKE